MRLNSLCAGRSSEFLGTIARRRCDNLEKLPARYAIEGPEEEANKATMPSAVGIGKVDEIQGKVIKAGHDPQH